MVVAWLIFVEGREGRKGREGKRFGLPFMRKC